MIDPQRVKDAKKALGARLARWRNARGLTQLVLARRVPISRTTIAGVESGRQCPDRIFWQRCEEVLQTGGELLAGYDDYRRLKHELDLRKTAAAQQARWGEAEDRPPPAVGRGVSAGTGGDPPRGSGVAPGGSADVTAQVAADVQVTDVRGSGDGATVTLEIMSDGQATSLRVSRRTLLELAAGITAVGAVDTAPVSRTGAVDPAVLEYFTRLRALLVQADDQLGGVTILSTVAQQIALIAALRRRAQRPVRSRLLSMQARWSEFAGWLSDDLGDRAAGGRWLDQAAGLAQEADDREFSAYVLARQAQRLVGSGDEDRVVGLAGAASRYADAPPLVRAFAAVQQAHGSAIDNDTAAFQAAIARSHALAATASPTVDDGHALGGFCTSPYLAAQEGEGWLRLNDPHRAVECFTAAIDGWPERYRRERAVYLSRAAHAYLAASEPEQAATVAARALTAAATTGSARVRRDVTALAHKLTPFSRQPRVQRLFDQLTTVG